MKNILIKFFSGVYKILVSHALHALPLFLGSGCRFHPTCSTYAAEALERYGFFLGSVKACHRILRCNPFNHGWYEPLL
ncbi:MAG: membrane protein insertion efficiency factor YidD [Candidatus Sungbacteria bacterium]|nr:membrane protein insertion efficiency factor YidD [Candidatus Sungbacteria bacterium]